MMGENNKAFTIDFSTNQSLSRIVNNNSKAKECPGSVGEMLPCRFVSVGFEIKDLPICVLSWNGPS